MSASEAPDVWVAVNNYDIPSDAIENDRELNPETSSPRNYDNPQGPLELAYHLDERVDGDYGFKINGPLLDWAGQSRYEPDVIGGFQEVGRPLFADIKMYKGGGSMEREASQLSDRRVEFTNAFATAEELLEGAAEQDITLLGLTDLTHHPNEHYRRIFNDNRDEVVANLSAIAYEHGCEGLIMPPTALPVMYRDELEEVWENMVFTTPSIRPEWDTRTDTEDKQSQQVTSEEAFRLGADSIVVGSPIYAAERYSEDGREPAEALESILDER